ncbi:hypothetical protein ACFSQ3_13025 [Sphingobacterium corticis]|uniref:Uncharacterized protein n=1 Tax=Sphingobacterium corticis TaxID=1812823 RepID=A0ABW5NPE7_9SPHI
MLSSDQLRKYYRGVVIPHARDALIDAGFEPEVVGSFELTHIFFKSILHTPTTTTLKNKEFSTYIMHVQRICATYLNYYVPDANEQNYERYTKSNRTHVVQQY